MAIIKITRTQDNEQQFIDDTIAALNPYFDRVEHNTESTAIDCYVGDDLFLSLNLKDEISFRPVTVNYISDGANTINPAFTDSYGWGGSIDRVYVCNNGVMIATVNTDSGQTVLHQPVFGISKDNHGNTVIITPTENFNTTYNPNSKESSKFQAINKNSVKQTGDLIFYQNCVYACTTMSTIPVNDNGAYCPHAFKFDAKEHEIMSSNIRKLTLNDVDYLSNGFWCIRDI